MTAVCPSTRSFQSSNRLSHVVQLAKQIADLQAANGQLAAALYARDAFFATMSHELRTPLSAILGLTEILQDQIYGPINLRQHEALSTVAASGQHLLCLINDLLDLAKIEAGQEQLVLGPLLPNDIVWASASLVRPAATSRQIELVERIGVGLPPIEVDGRRLKQMLVNLLANAVKFTAPGGSVGIEVVAAEAESIAFSVWDSGIGISEAHMQQLFQPFVQLHSGLSRDLGGTGLGLALVAHLVAMHGGGISLRSTVGAGSCFTITLPYHAQARIAVAAPLPRPVAEVGSVLIAAGSMSQASYLADGLRDAGHRCVVVADGLDVLALARAARPRAILLDKQMAGLDAMEVVRRLRAEACLARLPLLLLSAITIEGDAERACAAGASDYLAQPVLLPDLLARLERHLARA